MLAVSKNIPAGHGVIPDYQIRYYAHDILLARNKELELSLKIIAEAKAKK